MLHTVYHGIMLGVSDAERQELLTAVQQCGSQWVNDITTKWGTRQYLACKMELW